MIQKMKRIIDLISNMGMRYLLYRIYYIIRTKMGWMEKSFPVNPPHKSFITLKEWRKNPPSFFFYGKKIEGLQKKKSEELKQTYRDIKNGIFIFFSKSKFDLGTQYDWLTNPVTNHQYNIEKHWSQIQDLSSEAGDIKFVWEKARFSYLYDMIRYDYHFEEDQSVFVLSEIEDFIDKNPINQGPNYKCSQEISLRVLNWTFALYYYKDSDKLTEVLFGKIQNAIYWQLHHVYQNIHFSRIAVRNNHAITETLMLYLSNKLFPFIPETKKWSEKGKKWFEKEIDYQIYDDGTFLQYSMNYHRVVVQLLTWGVRLSDLNKERFDEVVYNKARKSLDFLDTCIDPKSGELPNYGSNDGALFFKLTDDDYRNYRAQLDDLRLVLDKKAYHKSESAFWYGFSDDLFFSLPEIDLMNRFKKGGYYIIQEENVKTFIKCGAYKDRPAQSDNLHVDIWVDGRNYLRDSGSYKYNTSNEFIHYFNGCEGHNTVSLSKNDQMLKGNRFIWYNWVKKAIATLEKENDAFVFKGRIEAFKNIGKGIWHSRKVTKLASQNIWEIEDHITNKGDEKLYQYWHVNPEFIENVKIITLDENNKEIEAIVEEKWYSSYYGVKDTSIRLTFVTSGSSLNTRISIKE